MKIDEDLIKKKFDKLIKSDSVQFFQKGEKKSNVRCKRVVLVDLSVLEEIDGITQFEVKGRGDFFESLDCYGRETSMNFGGTILVQGDDILNEAETRVDIYSLHN